MKPCTFCHGVRKVGGSRIGGEPCPECRGTGDQGQVNDHVRVEMRCLRCGATRGAQSDEQSPGLALDLFNAAHLNCASAPPVERDGEALVIAERVRRYLLANPESMGFTCGRPEWETILQALRSRPVPSTGGVEQARKLIKAHLMAPAPPRHQQPARGKAMSERRCMHCNQPGGIGPRELRPYGPGGADVCAECTFKGPPERLKEAERQLGARLMTGDDLVLDPREQVGPIPRKAKGNA